MIFIRHPLDTRDMHAYDEALIESIREVYAAEPAEKRAAVRRYVQHIPGQITRLSIILAIVLVITTITHSAPLGLFCIAIIIGASYALQTHCRWGSLIARAISGDHSGQAKRWTPSTSLLGESTGERGQSTPVHHNSPRRKVDSSCA